MKSLLLHLRRILPVIGIFWLAEHIAAQQVHFSDFEETAEAQPALETAMEDAGLVFEKPLLFPVGWKFKVEPKGSNEYRLVESEAASHSGIHSIYVRGNMQCETYFPVEHEHGVRVKFWAKDESGSGIKGAVYKYDSAYKFLGEERLEEVGSSEWSEYTLDFVRPNEAGSAAVVSHVAVALGSEGGAYFDDVTVEILGGDSATPSPAASETGSTASSRSDPDLVKTTVLEKDWQIEPEGTGELKFELGDLAGKQVRLRFDGRIKWGGLGGSTQGMMISVNGQPLVGRRLMNKPLSFTMREGTVLKWADRDSNSYRLMYSADFSNRLKTDKAYLYGLPQEDQDPFHFLWDITSFVLPGTNTMTVSSPNGMSLTLKFRDVAIEMGDPIAYKDPSGEAEVTTPSPSGPLPVIVPKILPNASLSVEISPTGVIRFQAESQFFLVQSRSSLPYGKWTDDSPSGTWERVQPGAPRVVKWDGVGYEVERTITAHAGRITVMDSVRNTGTAVVGVIVENHLKLPGKPERTLLGGREAEWVSETQSSYHPTAMATLDGLTVGMVADNDLFRLHASLFREDQVIGLADRRLGIPVGGAQILEWSIYVLPQGDYWDFINAIRRDWGSNFALTGPVSFTALSSEWGHNWETELTVDTLRKWLAKRNNALPMIMTHVATDPNVSPATATKEEQFWYHGTAIPYATHWLNNTRAIARLAKEADPKVKVFAYIHPNLTTEVGYDQKYRDSVALDANGNPAKSVYKPEPGVFIPTLKNSYGEALKKIYQNHIDDLDANLYVDEITVGIPHEGAYTDWDECTAVIDPVTHEMTGKISNAILLMQPWLDAMISYAKIKGKTAFVNTAPPTRTMLNWKIQHITEDSGPAGITSTHLSTPLAWTYDTGELPGYQHIRESLRYGAISFSRSGDWSDHMFPLTPIELHSGTIIGEERILTIHSGKFGWGDDSGAETLVYDGQGRRVEKPDVREVREGNQVFTEIRMPGDHLAILVRRWNQPEISSKATL